MRDLSSLESYWWLYQKQWLNLKGGRPRLHPNYEALLKGQNNQKLCLSFYHSLVFQITSFFCTISCIFYRVIYWVFHPPNIHSVSNPCDISLGHCFWWGFYWLAANYILTYFPEIQQIFSWLTTKCTGLTLGSTIKILNHSYQDYMTGRQFLVSWGIFNSILCHVNCRVSSVKYWQCSNITIARGGQF